MSSTILASAGEVGWSSKVNNAISSPQLNGFRLTLTSGTPVTTSDVTGATTIYLTPYVGNRISLYDGSGWQVHASAEISLALGTLTADKNYDVFVYDNAGTVAIDTLVAWTSDTARATDLTSLDGVLVKSGTTTRRYVGTIRTTSTTTTADAVATRFVWNAQNRVGVEDYKDSAVANWAPNGQNGAWKVVNAVSGAPWHRQLVIGWPEHPIAAEALVTSNYGGGGSYSHGFASDSNPANFSTSADLGSYVTRSRTTFGSAGNNVVLSTFATFNRVQLT